jgi:nicotinate-nucleotide adenylyltransferase
MTLNRIKDMFPQKDVFFLLGVDAFLEIETWKDYEDVLEQCSFIVMSRPGYSLDDVKGILTAKYNRRMIEISEPINMDNEESFFPKIYLLPIHTLDISSSEVRERVGRSQSIKGLVPENVENYIKEKHLYLPRQ